MGLFILGYSEVYKEWLKVGKRDFKSDSSDAEMGYIQEAPGYPNNIVWLKKQPEISKNWLRGKAMFVNDFV